MQTPIYIKRSTEQYQHNTTHNTISQNGATRCASTQRIADTIQQHTSHTIHTTLRTHVATTTTSTAGRNLEYSPHIKHGNSGTPATSLIITSRQQHHISDQRNTKSANIDQHTSTTNTPTHNTPSKRHQHQLYAHQQHITPTQ